MRVVSFALLVAGCGGPVTDLPDGEITLDGSIPEGDAGPVCTNAECDDGMFCNGVESCGEGGCMEGVPPCAAAMCDEETDTCACSTPDADGDGSNSIACGGADCDDDNPLRAPGNPEVCDVDDVDEDCDPSTYGFRDLDMDGAPDVSCCNVDREGAMRCGNDCNDMASSVNPTTSETCNGIDDNCDGAIDEDQLRTFYLDADGDGFGIDDAATNISACFVPSGYATTAGDCDDAVAAVHPGAHDRCDAAMVDDDCNGTPNDPPEGCTCTGSGSMPCSEPGACAAGTITCVGGAWTACSIAPVTEVCDGRDEDCDGTPDDGTQTTCFADGDGDGYAASGATPTLLCPSSGGFGGCPTGYTSRPPVSSTLDCDDTEYAVSPAGSESCNGVDDDCDGTADEGLRVTCYADVDSDTYSAMGASATSQCADPTRTLTGLCPIGWTDRMPSPADCDDMTSARSPAAAEVCDGIDQDCDGMIDETVAVPCYEDIDGDGFAAMDATSSQQCRDPSRGAYGFCPIAYTNVAPTSSAYDCAPTNAAIHPDASETCGLPAVDEDCDGLANPPAECSCGDGSVQACPEPGVCGTGTQQCVDGTWGTCSVSPEAETCDGTDEDCDGSVDEGLRVTCYSDSDSDTYAPAGASPTPLCPVGGRVEWGGCPPGYTSRAPVAGATDCADTNADVSPAAAELCDAAAVDEDCDGVANPTSQCECSGSVTRACPEPGRCGAGTQQCVDGSWGACSIAPATEICNGEDDDCDGTSDEGLRVTCYADVDNDTYSATGASMTSQCADPTRTLTGLCPIGWTDRMPSPADCDDAAAGRSPAATEVCDGIDQDCDGMIDETVAVPCYEDVDGDGFAAMGATSSQQCRDPSRGAYGFCPIAYTNAAPTSSTYDCAPTNAAIHPDASETCGLPAVDEDCDGLANPPEDCTCGDGSVQACPEPGVCGTGTQQCVGGTWGACSVSPEAETCDGTDEDCDGSVDEGLRVTCYSDSDNDTYAPAGASPTPLCPVSGRVEWGGCPPGYTSRAPAAGATDCADADADISPAAAELCDAAAVDEDCDGIANPPSQCECSGSVTRACPEPGRCSAGTQQCVDGSWGACSIGPTTEICNGEDDDCDGATDENGPDRVFYLDADGDGYGIASSTTLAALCTPPPGYSVRSDDCNDADMNVHPDAPEVCDTVDSNCSSGGGTDSSEDADGDGHAPLGHACVAGTLPKDDCDDTRVSVFPGACEQWNGTDDDCDGLTDEGTGCPNGRYCNESGVCANCSGGSLVGDCNSGPQCETNLGTQQYDCGGCGIRCGSSEVCLGGICRSGNVRRVFLAGDVVSGAFGSAAALDTMCMNRVNDARIYRGRAWRAWVSDATGSVATRFTTSSYDYVLMDGTVVANGWSDLTDGTLDNPIQMNAHGQGLTSSVWTGTTASGASSGVNCSNWSSSSSGVSGTWGVSYYTNASWTAASASSCASFQSFYCFEQ